MVSGIPQIHTCDNDRFLCLKINVFYHSKQLFSWLPSNHDKAKNGLEMDEIENHIQVRFGLFFTRHCQRYSPKGLRKYRKVLKYRATSVWKPRWLDEWPCIIDGGGIFLEDFLYAQPDWFLIPRNPRSGSN